VELYLHSPNTPLWGGAQLGGAQGQIYLYHRVQTGSWAHPASYPMGTRGSFLRGKASGAWSWPLTSI
jgi:hypothetical protein